MSEKKQDLNMEELVDYTAPLFGDANTRDIFVAVNGESILIKRGEPVKIKRKFLEVIQNAEAQNLAVWKNRNRSQLS